MEFMKGIRLRKCFGLGRVTETLLNSVGFEKVGDLYERRAELYLVVSSRILLLVVGFILYERFSTDLRTLVSLAKPSRSESDVSMATLSLPRVGRESSRPRQKR